MNKTLAAAVAALIACNATQAAPAGAPPFDISLQHLSSISTASIGSTGAEIVAFDARTQRAFAINSTDNDLAVIDLADPAAPILLEKVSLAAFGAGLNGVDTHDGLVAVAVEASPKTDPGKVVFIDAATLIVRGAVTVGALPDMLTFDADGERVLVANEGEPESYLPGAVNPEGSVSIIDLSRGVARARVRTADFRAFSKDALLAKGVRVFGPGASAAQDLEPEYITVSGRTAWVTVQEANAVAVVDVPTATVTDIVSLGLKDHSVSGHGLDPSDRDGGIRIGTWPVFGLYQPDAIASFRVGPQQFLVTANEGDSRSSDDFPGFNEEVRLSNSGYVLDPTAFPNAAVLKGNAALGRLNVTNASGDTDGDGDFDQIHVFGARSFSIWTTNGELVWDSGEQLEQFFAEPANGYAAIFNASNNNNNLEDRSDNKGPEPEGVAVGRIGGRSFAFIGLERIGGVMAYDVTDPYAPAFAAYANTRSLTEVKGDRGAEGVEFVSGDDSPNGQPLVLVGNETSRTVSIFQVNRSKR
ncbi:MAG: choice-of-anchor I family protein [Steroidobacteraceae bacterium]|nr:choice-of-anchor I family protein [Steroidobacteraceae bacterium]